MSNNNSTGEITPLKIKRAGFYSKKLTLSGGFLKWLLIHYQWVCSAQMHPQSMNTLALLIKDKKQHNFSTSFGKWIVTIALYLSFRLTPRFISMSHLQIPQGSRNCDCCHDHWGDFNWHRNCGLVYLQLELIKFFQHCFSKY